MIVLRFSTKWKSDNFAAKSRPLEESTAGLRAGRSLVRNSTASATATYQSNVIRIHTSQREPPIKTGWPPIRPRPRRRPQSAGDTCSTTKNALGKDRRVFQWREHKRYLANWRCSEIILGRRRLRPIETSWPVRPAFENLKSSRFPLLASTSATFLSTRRRMISSSFSEESALSRTSRSFRINIPKSQRASPSCRCKLSTRRKGLSPNFTTKIIWDESWW